jgi:PAS domain-containing protein
MNNTALIDSAFEPAFICNLKGQILFANPSFATIYNKTTKWFERKKPELSLIFSDQHKTRSQTWRSCYCRFRSSVFPWTSCGKIFLKEIH